MPSGRIVVGIMSGTSADGIDAVACDIRGRGINMRPAILAHVHHPYDLRTRNQILRLAGGAPATAAEFAALNSTLGHAFAQAATQSLRQARIAPGRLAAVGCHGQTIHHLPPQKEAARKQLATSSIRHAASTTPQLGHAPGSWQLGDLSIVAECLRAPVVGRFRDADIAAGGQGAPLVPWTDYVLFRRFTRPMAIQNIGGIANVTWLPGGGPETVIAFDCGPGNMVIDDLMRHYTSGKLQFDMNGKWAAAGTVSPTLLRQWQRHPYFTRQPPKSCGREEFGASFWQSAITAQRGKLSPRDAVATCTRLTAWAIGESYRRFLRQGRGNIALSGDIIVCGGGAMNPTLLSMIANELPTMRVKVIDDLGIPNQAKEALSFAMLACACIDGVPANLPRVTGARRPVICGQIAHA